MNQKSFHPASKANQKKIWIAEQKAADNAKRETDRARKLQEEKDMVANRNLAAGGGSKSNEDSLKFMYEPPPGFRATKEESNEEGDSAEKKDKNDGKQLKPEEKFAFLKNAPVAGDYAKNVAVHHRPLGIEVKNVRCLRCGEWGHAAGDKECPQRDVNKPNAFQQRIEDPMSTMNMMTGDNNDLILRPSSFRPVYSGNSANQLLLEEDDSDSDLEQKFLASLTKSQKRKILRYFAKEEKKKRRAEREERKKEKTKESHHHRRRHSPSK